MNSTRFFLLFFISFSFLFPEKSQAQCTVDTWTQKTSLPGVARREPTGFSIGGKGYVGTGYDNSNRLDDFWEYDTLTGNWTQKANFGGGIRDYAVSYSIGGKGFLGTGYFPFAQDMWEYDPVGNAWVQKNNVGGLPRSGAIGFSIGGKGYVGLGWDGAPANDLWQYDTLTGAWTQMANFGGPARLFAVGFAIGNKGYAGLGGENFVNYKKDFWEYDPVGNTWTKKADFGGVAREGAAGFSLFGKGFVGLGYDGPLGTVTPYKDFWMYDPATDTWCKKADFGGIERYYVACFTIGNKGYICSGWQSPNGQASGNYFNDLWEYCPDTSCVTCTPPNVSVTPLISTICFGVSTTLKAIGAKTYSWSPPNGLNFVTGDSVSASPTDTTTYTVTGVDSVGCPDTALVTVNVIPLPIPVVNGNTSICAGDSTTLTASGGLSYSWSTGSSADSITVKPSSPQTYTLIASDGICEDSVTVTVTVNPVPVAVINGNTAICSGDSSTLTASGGSTYSWSTNATSASIKVAPSSPTSYIVAVMNGSCVDTASITVTITTKPTADAGKDTSICEGNNVQLHGAGGITYSWKPSATLSSATSSDPFASPISTTNYLMIAYSGSCSDSDTVQVVVNTAPIADAGLDTTIYQGNSTMLHATGGGTYLWSPTTGLSDPTIANPVAKPFVTTTYYVTVTNADGCTASDSVTVFVDITCGELFVPSAFSPNGDGENDSLYVRGNCVKMLTFKIFNRWGETVFECTDVSQGWPGEPSSGTEREETSVYAYFLHATFLNGAEKESRGNITLIR